MLSTVFFIWFIELFISNISRCQFGVFAQFQFLCWIFHLCCYFLKTRIDFLTLFFCLFESSLRLLIIFKSRFLNSLAFQPGHYLWIQYLLVKIFWRSDIALLFSYCLCFYIAICSSVDVSLLSTQMRKVQQQSQDQQFNNKPDV
jgi:hypothetical protein